MPVTPQGPISLTLESLRLLVASCPSFRAWVGGDDEPATVERAMEHVFPITIAKPDGSRYTPTELEEIRPYVLIRRFVPTDRSGNPLMGGEVFTSRRISLNGYQQTSKWILEFEDGVPEEDIDNTRDAEMRFANNVGLTIADIEDLANKTDHVTEAYAAQGLYGLGVTQLEILQSAKRCDEPEKITQGDYWTELWVVTVGV